MAKPNLTSERLREVLSYDPETGVFQRRVNSRRRKNMLVPAGGKQATGHISIFIDGCGFLAHRLAWLYTFGRWPDGVMDHINGVRDDNRMSNLRDVDPTINAQNRRAVNTRTGKRMGFSKRNRNLKKPYAATIEFGGKKKHIGYFKTPEEAHEAYLSEKRQNHPGCTI